MRSFLLKAGPLAVIAIAGILVVARPSGEQCAEGEVCPPPPDCVAPAAAREIAGEAMRGPSRRLDPFGFNDGSVFAGQTTAAEITDLHREIGATLIRFALDWRRVEPEPRAYDFSAEDEIYCAALAHGVAPVIAIAAAPAWAAVPAGGCPQCLRPPAPEHDEALAELARIVTERYPGAAAIEAWNEPNLPLFWEHPDPARYAEILAAIDRGVRAAGGGVPVLGGSLANASGGPGTVAELVRFLNGLYRAGGGKSMDALAIHPYPVFPAGDPRQRFDDMLRIARSVAARHRHRDQPIWITELGLRTDGGLDHDDVAAANATPAFSAGDQARTMVALYRQASSDPQIRAVIFHTLVEPDGRVASHGGYGWVSERPRGGFAPKPVWCAMLEVARPGQTCRSPIEPGGSS